MQDGFEQARDFFLRGVDHYRAGRFEQAERQFAASLDLLPGRVSTLTNLGAARLKLGRAQDAIAVLDEALEQEPANTEALSHRATAFAELGQYGEALRDFDRSLQLQPAQGAAWMHRGTVLRDVGRVDEAIASFEQALAHGADRELVGYYLAALRGGKLPTAAPRGYVQALFDSYAGEFDAHLVRQLRYDAPGVLTARLQGRFAEALDLGCGTGLCGRRLASMCDAIDGVDLAQAMLDKAAATGAYRELSQGDLVEHLRQTSKRYDLVIAADVLIYVGDLDEVFAGVRRVSRAGAPFCFTVEDAQDESQDFVLRRSLRYAHSRAYLERLASSHGFTVDRIESRAVREDQQVPISGWFCWMRS